MSATAPAAVTRPALRNRRQLILLGVLILIAGATALREPGFLSVANLRLIGQEFGHLSWLVLGMTLVILAAGIDLSVGSNVALSAMALGLVFQASGSILLGCLAGLSMGALAGAANGLLISVGRIPALVVTLATLAVFRGGAYALGGDNSFRGFPEALTALGNTTLLKVPVTAWFALVGITAGGLFLARSRWGRELYALGTNPQAAALSGVMVRRWRFWLYTVAGLTAGMTAILYAARFQSVKADIAGYYELQAITAVVLGGTHIAGGSGSVFGSALGLLTLIVLQSALRMWDVPGERHAVAVALLLILAVWIDTRGRQEQES